VFACLYSLPEKGGWGHSSCERQLHAPESSPSNILCGISLDTYYIYRLPWRLAGKGVGPFCVCGA